MDKTKIICIVGATASGKTALSVELAKAIDGEIISADSMQVYKDMPIATAVATKDERQGIPHYLTEFLEPSETYSVADFVKDAAEKIADISKRGKTPIVVGGTGLFVDSLVNGVTFSDVGVNSEIRARLEKLDNEMLYNRLKMLDPQSALEIHPNNRKRVIRALELCLAGTTKTEQDEKSLSGGSPYKALYIGVSYVSRQKLYDRINKRVDLMLENGLLAEAEKMLPKTSATSRQAIGHKELAAYINGEITLDAAVENLKRATRNYAKRQLTWFRRNDDIHWLYADEMTNEELINEAVTLSRDFITE